MCRRKKLYDQIDAGITADGFYDVVRRENNELFSDPKHQRDGTILRWLCPEDGEKRGESELLISTVFAST